MIIKLVDFQVIPDSIDNGKYLNDFSAEYTDHCGSVVQLSCRVFGSNYDNLDVRVSTTTARQKFLNAAIECFTQLIKNTNCYIDCIAYDDERYSEKD